tara:strand:- start:105 stop:977 length:873 start_codon:yes stop_codon:yes gene_type:complete
MFNKSYLKKNFNYFLKIYKKRPIENNQSGMKIDHCFALFCLLKKIKPKYIIESGVWKGQTTWLIKNVLKNSEVFSIDLDLTNREVIYDDVKYLDKDITRYDWKQIDKNKTLIIFDDHVCFSKRLNFLKKNKFKHIIFDDNLPNHHISYYTPKMIYEKQYLIKKEFIKYSNISRLVKFIIKYFKKEFSHNIKLNFNPMFVKITYPKKINKNLKKKFVLFRKTIKIYYEFPPLKKFNYKKRFKKILNNFNEGISNNYNVQKPIFKKNEIKLSKGLTEELNAQYSNMCYINLN